MPNINPVVQSLWIGPALSKLELLTLKSFVAHGHEFHLWCYAPLTTPLPEGIVLRDASEILPASSVFRKRSNDPETSLGEGSYATFSDLFRTKLLYDHGGIWVDMDVLCLRPFDFEQEYVFRAHRVGAVMNLMKCPKGSPLLREVLETMQDRVHEDAEWFTFTRAFTKAIYDNGLQRFIRSDLMPPDRWSEIEGFIYQDQQFNPSWYAIHWINELWAGLRKSGGFYKGDLIAERLPDKNHPIPGSTLFRLYQKYGLINGDWSPGARPTIAVSEPSGRQPPRPSFLPSRHINVALPSMTLGGAERAVYDVTAALCRWGATAKLFLQHAVSPSYPAETIENCEVAHLSGMGGGRTMQAAAMGVLASPVNSLFVHLLRTREYSPFTELGVKAIPVIQNSQPAWQDPPRAYDLPCVPFIVAVSQDVKNQLEELGCTKPVVVLRHEVHRACTPERANYYRRVIRDRYGVRDDTLLIGMVGQFKAQKAYTRAVRVLHTLRQHTKARLMIIGGWNQEWGSGRATYNATCRQALELGVMPDLLLPGQVNPVEAYFPAFDVFLNTSLYEGLSVAMLEAIAYGCPVVTSDAGGNREALTKKDVLIEEQSDIDAYVRGILKVAARKERTLRVPGPDSDLVARMWCLLGQYGVPDAVPNKSGGGLTLIFTENLSLGGPQRSLANLLAYWPKEHRVVLGVLDAVTCEEYLRKIEDAGVTVFSLRDAPTMTKVEQALYLARRLGARTIAFWNAPANFKLAVAKVLEVSPVRLVDVSPGPMLFRDLAEAGDFPRRISLGVPEYFARLNYLVSKYKEGLPGELRPNVKHLVIPNGVSVPPEEGRSAALPLGAGESPGLAIGTCCRIAPSKKVEYLIDMMEALTRLVPGVSLTVVGDAAPRHERYASYIADKVERSGLRNIHFVGPHADVTPFLRSFKVFVMISDDQGCPNASLEAMAAGLPVVANASGGTSEQVEDGVNGFLVPDDDPYEMARAVEALLRDGELRKSFGRAALNMVRLKFPMQQMVSGYLRAFAAV